MSPTRSPLALTLNNLILMTTGALLGAVQVVLFMIPADVVPGGISSLAMVLHELISSPVGAVVLIANIPILFVGYRYLPGGWHLLARTVYVVVLFSIAVDVLTYLDFDAFSDDRLLNVLFGGAIGGLSSGLVFRGGGTYGGTSTIARMIQHRTGIPLSTTFLYTDGGLIVLAGIVFGWESSIYAIVAMVIAGFAADYALEGPSVVRTVFIITQHPQVIADMVIHELHRTVTCWDAEGMYAHQQRTVVYVTVPRSEATILKDRALALDPTAFVTIGQGHTAYGAGFKRARRDQ